MPAEQRTISAVMDQALRAGISLLDEEAAADVSDFILARLHHDGGFRGRGEKSDLYYSVFGVACLSAWNIPVDWERLRSYFLSFTDPASLDLVHLTCLARSMGHFPAGFWTRKQTDEVFSRLLEFRSGTGGFRLSRQDRRDSIYAAFLANLAAEDLHRDLDPGSAVMRGFPGLVSADGAWADEPGLNSGTAPVTAAAALLLQKRTGKVPLAAAAWLQQMQADSGGFYAAPRAPVPDLLSTASILTALEYADVPPLYTADRTREFIADLWLDDGGFCGHIADDTADIEYTFYALLALGLLKRYE